MNGENARIASISSPNSSMRSGSRPVVGKTSTIPPRTANCLAFLDPLHALVARKGQLLGQAVDPRLVADGKVEPRRASFRRRRPLRERRRRRTDEPSGGEHVERPGPLAHEVWRRLEPRVPADAAARKERDLLLA